MNFELWSPFFDGMFAGASLIACIWIVWSKPKDDGQTTCVACGARRIRHGVWEYPRHRTAIVQRICPTCFERGISTIKSDIEKL